MISVSYPVCLCANKKKSPKEFSRSTWITAVNYSVWISFKYLTCHWKGYTITLLIFNNSIFLSRVYWLDIFFKYVRIFKWNASFENRTAFGVEQNPSPAYRVTETLPVFIITGSWVPRTVPVVQTNTWHSHVKHLSLASDVTVPYTFGWLINMATYQPSFSSF